MSLLCLIKHDYEEVISSRASIEDIYKEVYDNYFEDSKINLKSVIENLYESNLILDLFIYDKVCLRCGKCNYKVKKAKEKAFLKLKEEEKSIEAKEAKKRLAEDLYKNCGR